MKILLWFTFAVVLVGTLTPPLWICTGGQLDCQQWLDSLETLEAAHDREAAWTEQLAAVQESMAAKGRVATDLTAGRLTLRAAAFRFRELDRQRPDFNWKAFRHVYPAASDGERQAREVIQAVRAIVGVAPWQEGPPVVVRLEAELRECLARNGTVPLDPDEGDAAPSKAP
jgi:hypothetical protein